MNEDSQLKLQSHLDGELSEREAREVQALLAGDGEARALLAELRNTNTALAGFEADVKLPESREFYWSKIRRAIELAENPRPARVSGISLWRKILIPAGALAALAIAALISLKQAEPRSTAPQIETFFADAGAMTYRDEAERTTVVWLSYPGENDFANRNSGDTLD